MLTHAEPADDCRSLARGPNIAAEHTDMGTAIGALTERPRGISARPHDVRMDAQLVKPPRKRRRQTDRAVPSGRQSEIAARLAVAAVAPKRTCQLWRRTSARAPDGR
jgi:hypothetical protein